MNEATDTIREVTKGFTGEQKEAVNTLLGHLESVAGFAQEAHNAAKAGRPDAAEPCVRQATAASEKVQAATAALRTSVGALVGGLDTAVTAAVDAAKQAAASVPGSVKLANKTKARMIIGTIDKDTTLEDVVAKYKEACPANAQIKALDDPEFPTSDVKLQDWWLTRNSSPACAEAMLGTGDAAEAARGFAGTLDALCDDLKLPRTSCCHVSPNCCCVLLLFHSP